jgi:hypothetical protein
MDITNYIINKLNNTINYLSLDNIISELTSNITRLVLLIRNHKDNVITIKTRKYIIIEIFEVLLNNLWYIAMHSNLRNIFASKIIEFETDTNDSQFIDKLNYYKRILYPDLFDGFSGNMFQIVDHYANFIYKNKNIDDIQIDEKIIPFENYFIYL